jgi:hypothetical protein
MQRKSWSELSARQRTGIEILGLLQVLLLAAAQWDLSRRSSEEVNGDKRLWRLLVFINFIGPIAYFLVGRR